MIFITYIKREETRIAWTRVENLGKKKEGKVRK